VSLLAALLALGLLAWFHQGPAGRPTPVPTIRLNMAAPGLVITPPPGRLADAPGGASHGRHYVRPPLSARRRHSR
jgi:hypothetical protein